MISKPHALTMVGIAVLMVSPTLAGQVLPGSINNAQLSVEISAESGFWKFTSGPEEAIHQPIHLAQTSTTPATQSVSQAEFAWSAEKTGDGVAFSGSVPHEGVQKFLIVRAGGEAIDNSNVREGAPDAFVGNSLAGIDALKELSSGRVAYTGDNWTLEGLAPTKEVLATVLDKLNHTVDITKWVVSVNVASKSNMDSQTNGLQTAEFQWAVEKNDDGQLEFSGNVPSEGLQNFLSVRAGEGVVDNTAVGEGAPEQFIGTAVAAVNAIKSLLSGRIAYENKQWTLNGFAGSKELRDDLLADLGQSISLTQWNVIIQVSAEPEGPVVVAESTGPTETPSNGLANEPDSLTSATDSLVDLEYQFNALKADGGQIAMSGTLPTRSLRLYTGVITNGAPIEAVDIAPVGAKDFANNTIAGLSALEQLESGLLAYEDGTWTLIGDALDAEHLSAASRLLANSKAGQNWNVDIIRIPVFDICVSAVADFSETQTILFAPASSRLTSESGAALDNLAASLNVCPEVLVYIEGHTDADGPADSNMTLSVARAESVVLTLVGLGVADTRLYAIGYGETLPIATNDTRAGKALNRRIVFELVKQ